MCFSTQGKKLSERSEVLYILPGGRRPAQGVIFNPAIHRIVWVTNKFFFLLVKENKDLFGGIAGYLGLLTLNPRSKFADKYG